MNRRGFFAALAGLVIAPAVAKSATPLPPIQFYDGYRCARTLTVEEAKRLAAQSHFRMYRIAGQPTRYQTRLRLESVGREWNGCYRPIDVLSYKPE